MSSAAEDIATPVILVSLLATLVIGFIAALLVSSSEGRTR